MPKLYEYFGLVVLFYSNEHAPVHVHALYQGRECRADFVIVNGKVVDIEIHPVRGRRPLDGPQMNDFKLLVNEYADEIVRKWVDCFVLHKSVKSERIDRRLK